MRAILTHLRGNAVAYIALFVALGGTSYAAISLPAGSVGNRQLQNRAIDAAKLNPDEHRSEHPRLGGRDLGWRLAHPSIEPRHSVTRHGHWAKWSAGGTHGSRATAWRR